MKKLLFIALVAVGMTACMQNEELAAPKGDAIAFENAYVGNSVRAAVDPSQTTNSIDSFNVWGYMNSVNGTVFEGTEVTKNGNVWGYVGTQYWMPGNEYHFSALSPIDGNWNKDAVVASVEGLSNVQFTNDGTVDLLYAHENVSTVGKGLNDTYAPVALEFEHLLSKVKFTFVNGFGTNNNTVEIKNLTMTAPKSATINLTTAATKEWDLGAETVALSFGDVERLNAANNNTAECANECLTIPASADYTYSVKFDVYVYVGTELALKVENKEATISGYALEMGNAYNFTAEITPANLGLAPIEFTATVQEWNTVADAAVGKYVYDLVGLQAAVDAAVDGDVICLGNDIAGELTIVQKKNVKLTLNGNGHKYVGQIKIHGNSNYQAGCATVIKNVEFETETADNCSVYAVDFGNAQRYSQNITVEGCTFTATGAAAQTAVGVKVNASKNLVVKGCTATNMHSLLQAQSCDDAILVDGCTTVGCKNGVSFGNTAYPTLRNSEIAAAEYGVRADGNASRGALVVANTTIAAKQGIVVRKVTTAGYSVNLGAGVDITTAENYQVVFTSGSDDVAYVKPTVDFSYTSVDEFNVFPLSQVLEPVYFDNANTEAVEGVGILEVNAETGVTTYGVTSANGLKWISAQVDGRTLARSEMKPYEVSGNTVKLLADIDLSEENWDPIGDNRTDIAFSGVFDGQDYTIKGAHITGDHCFNGAVYGSKEGWGLFSVLDGATVKNLKVDGATFGSYTVISGVIAGYANNTTFENIDITNSKVAGYNWYTGGVVGWAAGECTFKNVNLDETVAVGSLWDSHGQSAGGIAGGVSASAKITIEDCNIACVLDVINDVTSNYKWYIYRVAGMIIGNTNTTETKYNEVVTATATNVTCKNVTVTYGKWANYHYCEGFWNRGWGRYESSDYIGGVDQNEPHNHADGEEHCECIPFDQLFGGSSNGSGHYPVKGLAEFPGVTVVYPAEYTCPVCGQQHNNE